MDRIFFKYVSVEQILWRDFFLYSKMWRGGAKIKWRCAAMALIRWRENVSWNNGAVVRWRKDLKSGARRGGAN